jgi:hypothetical protein
MPSPIWVKSSFSAACGNCAEVAEADGLVLIRDSKDPDGPRLSFISGEWRAFLDGIRNGEFDHLAARSRLGCCCLSGSGVLRSCA